MKRIAVLMVGVLAVGQTGCSMFVSSTQMLTVTASDAEAEILVDGVPVGIGMAQCDVSRNQRHTVIARKGERVGRFITGCQLSTAGYLDAGFGFVWAIPFLGLLFPGSRELSMDNITVVLPNVIVIPASK